jgi:uncharacterized protein (DUF1778 family)
MQPVTPDEVVVVEARLLPEEFQALQEAAKQAGLDPNDFLRRAISDEALITKEVHKGARVLIKPRVGRTKALA